MDQPQANPKANPKVRRHHDPDLIQRLKAATGQGYKSIWRYLTSDTKPCNPIISKRWDAVMVANRKADGGPQ